LDEPKIVEGKVVHSASAVYHFVITAIDDPDDKKFKSEKSKKSKTWPQTGIIVHLKIVSKEAARVSKFMKPYLENPNNVCEIQIIPLDTPYR